MNTVMITRANIDDPAIVVLVESHRQAAIKDADPAACHALEVTCLKADNITLWSLCEADKPVSLGALKRLNTEEGEIKTMFTLPEYRGRGYAKQMLQHLLQQAQGLHYRRVLLETGSWDYFLPARRLYHQYGFVVCQAFAEYVPHPESVYMCKTLSAQE